MLIETAAGSAGASDTGGAADRASRRTRLFVGTAVAALVAAAAGPDPAAAQSVEACGPIDAEGNVACLPDGNPYEDGIYYATPDMPVLDLTVALAEGVAVELDPAQDGLVGVDLQGLGDASIALLADPDTTVSTIGIGQIGVEAISAAGTIRIEAPDVTTAGASARGINARSEAGGDIHVLARKVTTTGQDARGINAFAEIGGNVAVTVEGAVSTAGEGARGIVASSDEGRVAVQVGDVATEGQSADAIVAIGSEVAVTVGGDVITTGDSSPGIYAQGDSVELVIDGSVATTGFSSGAVAAMAYGDAVVRGTGTVETSGTLSRGVLAQAYDGDAIVDLSSVATAAESSSGITASSVTGETRVTVGSVSTGGGYSTGIQAFSTYGNVTVAATSAIRTEGMVSDGVRATGRGVIDVSVHEVETQGESSSAIVAMGSETHVAISGLVRTTGDSIRSGGGAYQAAIYASASSAPDATAPAGTVTVVNDGTVETTGYHTTGIQARAERGVSIGGTGAVRTEGDLASGIYAASNGSVSIHGDAVATQGQSARGIVARAGTDIEIVQQSVSTAGDEAVGLFAVTQSGDLRVSVENLSTDGASATGIEAQSYGGGETSIEIGSLSTAGATATAALVTSHGGGDVDMNLGSIRTEGLSSRAAAVTVNGEGAELVLVTGAVETLGDHSTALYISNYATDAEARVSLDISSIHTSGYSSRGLDLAGRGADMDVAVETVRTEGDRADAIGISGRNVRLHLSGSIETTGDFSNAVKISADGDVAVTNDGTIATSGTTSFGIEVFGQGDIHVASPGTITVDSGLSGGINARSSSGDVVVDASAVSAHGTLARGVVARTNVGDVRVSTGAIDVAGFNAAAVEARSFDGNVSVTLGGPVSVSDGEGANGVDAISTGLTEVALGDATVSGLISSAVTAGGADVSIVLTGAIRSEAFAQYTPFAIVRAFTLYTVSPESSGTVRIVNEGSIESVGSLATAIQVSALGDVRISGSGSVLTDGGDGIDVASLRGEVDLQQESIEVRGTGANAIDLMANGSGVSRLAFDSISGSGLVNRGISAFVQGELQIDGGSIGLSGEGGVGITAYHSGRLGIVLGSVSTLGTNSDGILATGSNPGGSIDIVLRDGSTAGVEADLIRALSNLDSVTITSSGLLSVAGAGAELINAKAAGPVSIDVHDLSVSGDGSRGIIAYSGEDATVTISGAVTGSANQVPGDPVVIGPGGIIADPALAIVDVRAVGVASVANQGTIATSGSFEGGIAIRGYSGAVISGAGSVSTTGAGATAVYAGANTVGASIVQGEAHTTGQGARAVLARSYGAVSVDIGTATTTGDDSTAIRAEGATGVLVTADTVTTAGTNSNGITAFSFGTSVVRAGSVTTTGANSAGIDASSYGGGDAVVFVTGAVNAADGSGVIAFTPQGAASVSVAEGASVSAGRSGIFSRSGDGFTLDNGGTITGAFAAVNAVGGAATIVNRGTITGALLLTDNADSIANSGTLTLGAGTTLGAGDDVITNSGLVQLAGNVDFGDGNDRFVNEGILAFAAPGSAAGATLMAVAAAVAPRSFTLAGLESFANSSLIDLSDGVAGDVLTLAGAYVGTGDAALSLDVDLAAPTLADRLVVGGAATGSTSIIVERLGNGVLTPSAVVLVQAGPGTTAGAFTLDPGSRFEGFVEFGLVHNAGTFALVGAPAPAAYRLLKVSEGSQNLWHDSADAVSAHLATARDTSASGGGFWFQALGEVGDRDETRTFTNAGFGQSVDLGYRQDDFGGQLGVDLAGGSAEGFRFGFTGGYQNSNLRFETGPDGLSYDGFNVGAYGQLRSGDFYATGLAKFDHHEVTASLGSIGTRATFGGNAYGARIEAGFTLGSDRFYAEPSVGIAYLRTDLDGLGAFGATVEFDTMEGVRALAGLRLGSRRTNAAGHTLTFYGAANLVAELAGEDGLIFATGADAIRLDNEAIGTHGAGTIGFSAETGPITGFIEANGILGGDYSGGGARAGLRIAF